MRGRNRNKGPNPLTRSYDSNGPDVKIRGTAQHIADKYSQLARDAQSSGDPVAAENYLQHAEHYYRIIAAAQEQYRQNFGGYPQRAFDDDEEGDEESGGNGFGYGPERGPPVAAEEGGDPALQPQPYEMRADDRPPRFDRDGDRPDRQDRERQDRDRPERDRFARNDRYDRNANGRDRYARPDRGPRPDYPRDNPYRDERGDRPERQDRYAPERFGQDRAGPERGGQERPERQERPEFARPDRPFRDRDRDRRREEPEEPGIGLPAFLTNPMRPAAVSMEEPAEVEAEPVAAAEPEASAEVNGQYPRTRRRRRRPAAAEGAPDLLPDAPAGE
jgi:hypothetical protein